MHGKESTSDSAAAVPDQSPAESTFLFAKALIYLTLGVTLCGFAMVTWDLQPVLLFLSGLVSLWLGARSLMSGYLGELYRESPATR